ncbi:tetratricopeptide repeat protein [Iodobacter arcticus]|uniref:Tetratricopeptide repeat protein n=1 Tax=Iodobacter arcticus TaxID=590593 RepID=A0ABW2QYY9_9NEIS
MPQHAEILSLLSKCHRLIVPEPELALRSVEEAYFLFYDCKLNDVELLVRITLPYARLLFSFGRVDESLAVLFKALTQAALCSHLSVQEELLQEIALTYYTLGDYQEAGEYWADCLSQNAFSEVAKLNALIGMGMIQFAHGHIEQALALHQRAVSLLNSQMPAVLHARAWINLASAFFQLNQWHESQHALVLAFPFAQQAKNQEFIGEIYIYMAKIALETNNLDMAKQKLAQAKASCAEWRWGDILQQLLHGRIFLASQQVEQAIFCFKNALEKASELGFAQHMMDAHHLLSMAYQRIGNKELAEYQYGCYQTACIRMNMPAKACDSHTMQGLLSKPAPSLGMLHCA